jgi:NAD+ synthase (glutamine-hydrolysing)
MRIALAQINNTVGDLEANAAKILDFARQGQEAGAELVAFPELALTGYPPRDLVEKRSFLDRTAIALEEIVRASANLHVVLVVGYVGCTTDSPVRAQNSAVVI